MPTSKKKAPVKKSPTKKSPAKPAKSAAAIRVPVDASLKARYDTLRAQIDTAKAKESRDWDAIWEAAGAIVEHEPPLYVVGGYKTAPEFFSEVLGENARNAYRNVRVAKFASPAEETKYGVSKLDAALAYLEAKLGAPLAHPPLPVAFDRLRIGKNRVLLENARREEILAATAELSKSAKKPTSSDERAAVASFAKHPALKSIRVRVRAGLVTFTGVPAASMAAFQKALGTIDWGRGK
ncbi:MAG TPA: hypothetical protein VF316_08760 [Polyangiaceae bacterium]